jgi:hypothetical protein
MNYCKTHDISFEGESECSVCISDHNAEIDSKIAQSAFEFINKIENDPGETSLYAIAAYEKFKKDVSLAGIYKTSS